MEKSRAFVVALGLLFVSCGKGATPEDTRVAAAGDRAAQRELRELEAEWAVASSLERQQMRQRLEHFALRFQDDPSSARARLLLARSLLLAGQADAAESSLVPVLALPAGLSRDEASIVLAAVRHHQKRDVEALALLEPLAGKLVTDEARHEFAQVRVQAALAARRWRLAVDTMVTWVDDAGPRADEVRPWVERALVQVPDQALSRLLEDWSIEHTSQLKCGKQGEGASEGTQSGGTASPPATKGNHAGAPPAKCGQDASESEGRKFVMGVVVHHLVKRALETDDPRLARHLLVHSPAWLRTSDAGDELTLLASRAEEEAHVSGRLVGVVVGGPDQQAKARSAALAAGLMQGLAATQAANGETIGLVFEGSDAGMRPALAALRGQGAVLLIGAMDPVSSLEALSFAESRRVPVVVLASPPELSAERLEYGFDFGAALGGERRVIEEALAKAGQTPVVFVGPIDTPCPPFESRPGQSTLPLSAWKEQGTRAIALLGDGRCAAQVMTESAGLPSHPLFVLGLDAVATEAPAQQGMRHPPRVAHVAVGQFPLPKAENAGDRFQAGEDSEVRASLSFFEAAGRDLAALVRVALAGVPTTSVNSPDAVRKLHDRARDGLLGATAPLLTTDRAGFGGRHQIERELRVVGLP